MFCSKCGKDIGAGRFCPYCGAPAESVQPVEAAPTVEQPAAAQETPVAASTAEEMPVAPAQETPVEQAPAANFGVQPPKKKKWPMVAGIVAAVVIVLGAVGFFAAPAIMNLLDPKAQAVTAMKNMSLSMETGLLTAFSEDNLSRQNSLMAGKYEIAYSYQLDSMQLDNVDYMSYLKANTINMNIQVAPDTQTIAGSFGLAANGSKSSALELVFFMDKNNVKFKVPQLFTESFTIPTNSVFYDMGISYTELFSLMSQSASGGALDLSMYSGTINAAIKDVFAGMNTLIDEAAYEKLGKITLYGKNGDVSATEFEVKVRAQQLNDCANTIVENLYNDNQVKTILGLLQAGGVTKDSIKQEISRALTGIGDVSFHIAVSDGEIVQINLTQDTFAAFTPNTSSKSSAYGMDSSELLSQVEITFLGKDSIYEDVNVHIALSDGSAVTVGCSGKDDVYAMNMKIDFADSEDSMQMDMDFTVTESDTSSNVKIDRLSMNMNVDSTSMSYSASGNVSVKPLADLTVKSSAFTNPINMDRMTSEQSQALGMELIQNMSVFKNVISDSLYNQLVGSMFGGMSNY